VYTTGNENSCDGYNELQDAYRDFADCDAAGYFWRSDLEICVTSGNEDCADFAYSCDVSDVSCQMYSPLSFDGPGVPAVIDRKICSDGSSDCPDTDVAINDWNDECSFDCVGYRNYHQMATEFEAEEVVDFIKDTATSCDQPGCDEFTNLDEVARGGEGKEYYSFLRLCVKPDDASANVRTYYTWEGSDTEGFQLKRWQLDSIGNTPVGTACTMGDPDFDCRDFYSPDTGEYNAVDFLSVVFASDDCHPFRRTLDSQTYYGIPSYSNACGASNAGCRLYQDNSSYNFQIVLQDDFEDGNVDGWRYTNSQDIPDVSRESVVRDGSSMLINQDTFYSLDSGSLVGGDSYSITFLAKGSGGIRFALSTTSGFSHSRDLPFNLTNEWQLLTIDMGELPVDEDYTYSSFRMESANAYIDFVTLKRINNVLVIKDSWETRQICEDLSSVGMNWCEAFEDSKGDAYALQGFSDLCMESVVGCEAFISFDDSGDRQWEYLVYDQDKLCKSPGCTRLARVYRDRFSELEIEATEYEEKYMIIDPSIDACDSDQAGCSKYDLTGDNTGYTFFENPGAKLCEFRDSEWWIVGEEDMPCPRSEGYCSDDLSVSCVDDSPCAESCIISEQLPGEEKFCLGGRAGNGALGEMSIIPQSNTCTSDDDCLDYVNFNRKGICTSWTGVCNAKDSGCQEYQDPFSPEMCDYNLLPGQKSGSIAQYGESTPACDFYYYKDVDDGTCNKQVDRDNGCVPFVDMSRDVVQPAIPTAGGTSVPRNVQRGGALR